MKVVHRLQKINVQVFCWLNSDNNLKSIALQGFQKVISTVKSPEAGKCFLRAQNIFLAEHSGSRYDYRTVHGSPIRQAISNQIKSNQIFIFLFISV